jgi:hypothetical protein
MMGVFGISATEHEEVPMPSIVGGLDIHRNQITFDYLDTATGEVGRGRVAPADRAHLRAWLARFEHPEQAAFAVEACTGWRYVAEELRRARQAPGDAVSEIAVGHRPQADPAERVAEEDLAGTLVVIHVPRVIGSGADDRGR